MEREGAPAPLEVTQLVPGDAVELEVGSLVPADLRLLEAGAGVRRVGAHRRVAAGREDAAPVAAGTALAELTSCLFMGTVVHAGSAVAWSSRTGRDTQFGAIAPGSASGTETEFQAGLRKFSRAARQGRRRAEPAIFVVNLVLHRPLLDALLFSLAIAVGITPQLLPAIVSTSLATGSRRLAQQESS